MRPSSEWNATKNRSREKFWRIRIENQEMNWDLKPVKEESLTGDRVNLPQVVLEQIIKSQSFGTNGLPFVFQLSHSTRQTHAVVHSFTAEPGSMALSPFLCTNLGLASPIDGIVQLTLIQNLPVCVYASISPLDQFYMDVPDMRALLESYLRRNHTTLTKGEVLRIHDGSHEHLFVLNSLKPADVCLCINTDMEVDIQPVDIGVMHEAAYRKLGANKPNEVEFGNASLELRLEMSADNPSRTYKVSRPHESRIEAIGIQFQVNSTNVDADVDLFASFMQPPSIVQHEFFCCEYRKGFVEIPAGYCDAPYLYVSIVSNASDVPFECILTLSLGNQQQLPTASQPLTDHQQPDAKKCSNCGASVPPASFAMHEVFCQRNNRKCNQCAVVMSKQEYSTHWHCDQCDKHGNVIERDKHVRRMHTVLQCDKCHAEMLLCRIAEHCKHACPERLVECRFCHLKVRAGGKSMTAKDLYYGLDLCEHESECGSRTIDCVKCGRKIQMKEVQMHVKLFHTPEPSLATTERSLSAVEIHLCKNKNCSNIEKLGPFKTCRSCSQLILGGAKDIQTGIKNLITRYHTQLTAGCDYRDHCCNRYCATATKQPMQPNEAAATAIQLVQQSAMYDKEAPVYYLCVADAKCARRRQVAEDTLSALGASIETCVKALAATNDSIERAGEWIFANS